MLQVNNHHQSDRPLLMVCVERQSAAAVAKDKLVMDVVESFRSANISLEKLDNPSYGSFFKTQ